MAAEDFFNGTRSVIIDDINRPVEAPRTANAVLIFGTARKGPNKQLVPITDDNVISTYGSIPNDASFDTSLPRSYYEISRSTTNGVDAYGFLVGDSKKANLILYESQGSFGGSGYGTLNSGDYGYTEDSTINTLSPSLIVEAITAGSDSNNGRLEVVADFGVPKSIRYTTPDGVSRTFGLDPFGLAPNAFSTVREVTNALNSDPDWSKWYTTSYRALRKVDLPVQVEQDPITGMRYIEVQSATDSYGDKLEALEEIVVDDDGATDNIPFGVTTFKLNGVPKKDNSPDTTTISSFVRRIVDEGVVGIDAILTGQTTFNKTLYLGKANSRWNLDLNYTWDTTASSANYNNFILQVIKANSNGTRTTIPKKNALNELVYWVDADGALFIDLAKISTTFQLGDVYVVSYNYKAFYAEANVRSLLEIGNEFSYFIKGDEIIFGGSTSTPLKITYSTRKGFKSSDINVSDFKNIVIQFVNPLTRPALGSTVKVTYSYLPELPAASGSMLYKANGEQVIQGSGLGGGDDGRLISKLRYKELISEAMALVELYPFKQIFIAGAYLDDVVQGYDDESGLPALQTVDWMSLLVPKIARRSNLVKECICNIAIRPPVTFDPESINNWFDRAINSNNKDIGRPADMIDAAKGPNSFRFNCIAGAPYVAISAIRNGQRYLANPAAIHTGLMQDLPIEESLTNSLLPSSVVDLGVKVLRADYIGGMNQKGYTFYTADAAGNFIIADAPTMAETGSNFDRQFVLMALMAAIDIARTTAQRYIGQARTQEVMIAMKNKCQKNVQYLVPKVFQDIRINIIDVPDGMINGKVKIGLLGITSREIRQVIVESRVQLV